MEVCLPPWAEPWVVSGWIWQTAALHCLRCADFLPGVLCLVWWVVPGYMYLHVATMFSVSVQHLADHSCCPWAVLSPYPQITHPAGCMSQFIKFFGEQILILWKFALLRKRILIFSPPPVGVVCYRGIVLWPEIPCLCPHGSQEW